MMNTAFWIGVAVAALVGAYYVIAWSASFPDESSKEDAKEEEHLIVADPVRLDYSSRDSRHAA